MLPVMLVSLSVFIKRIINEPMAAAIAYGIKETRERIIYRSLILAVASHIDAN